MMSKGNISTFKNLYQMCLFVSTGSTNWKCFAEIKSENIGADKPEYFTTKATVLFLRKENCMYQVSIIICTKNC